MHFYTFSRAAAAAAHRDFSHSAPDAGRIPISYRYLCISDGRASKRASLLLHFLQKIRQGSIIENGSGDTCQPAFQVFSLLAEEIGLRVPRRLSIDFRARSERGTGARVKCFDPSYPPKRPQLQCLRTAKLSQRSGERKRSVLCLNPRTSRSSTSSLPILFLSLSPLLWIDSVRS